MNNPGYSKKRRLVWCVPFILALVVVIVAIANLTKANAGTDGVSNVETNSEETLSIREIKADAIGEDRKIVSDFVVQENFSVKAADGDTVDISVDKDALQFLTKADIEEIVESNQDLTRIEVYTEANLLKLMEIPSRMTVVAESGHIISISVEKEAVCDMTKNVLKGFIEEESNSHFNSITILETGTHSTTAE